MVGTRWHPEDLCGYLHSDDFRKALQAAGQSSELYEHTNLPAFAEPTPDNPDPLGRQEGEALAPELGRTVDFLKAAKAGQPGYEWDSQYQGNPKVSTSGQVEMARLRYIDSLDEMPEGITLARGWDLAAKAQDIHDYSVGAKCGWDEETKTFYILDIWRHRLPWPKLKKRIVGLAKVEVDHPLRPVFKIGVEAVAGFEHSYQELRGALRGEVKVERRNPRGKDKLTRAQPWFNRVEARQVVLLRGEWNKDFLRELEVFPVGDHDDQIDAVTICHEVLTRRLVIRHG
jgi:predicted phage terminase large subunit-like protein